MGLLPTRAQHILAISIHTGQLIATRGVFFDDVRDNGAMNKDLWNRRQSYEATTLDEGSATDPFDLFSNWLDEALEAQDEGKIVEATAMSLATVTPGPDGLLQPDVRIVLLKEFDRDGFVFFTNYESAKARAIEANPRVALHIYWPWQQRQVRVNGLVAKIPTQDSEAYFAERPRKSQIAAWASRQSEPVNSRLEMEAEYVQVENRLAGKPVPCPPNWGGYRVRPERFEFWQGRASRLHDRQVFTPAGESWNIQRLCP